MTRQTYPEIDFEMMDKLNQDQTIAELIINQSLYWRRVGFADGKKAAYRAGKVDIWGNLIVGFIVGFVAGIATCITFGVWG